MNFKWIMGLIFLMGCTSSKNMVDQKIKKDLSIELVSYTQKKDYFDFNFAIKNNTNRPVTILKHKGIKERDKNDVVLASAFYNLEFLPYEVMCEEEVSFMDQEIESEKVFKTSSDFVTIESKKKYVFNLKSEDYLLGICDKNVSQFNLVVKYDPKKQYFQKEFFDQRYKYVKEAEPYFNELEKTHQFMIISDTILVKL
ncbi:MAG: hypothetical protein AB8H03_04315 [Saprospiraceae bacterium]